MAQAAVPARYMLERQDWRGAAQLKPLGLTIPQAEAVTHFARALGAARSGDVAAAQADVAKLIEIRAGLEKANQSYWAGQVEIQVLAAQAGSHRLKASRRRRSSSCALPPISKTAARNTWRWRTAFIRCVSCWATC